ncbi:YraN family protein [Candidatus Uhrbacteria bacterium]|nr:YraN family protein [Candidatus Uhrbacteria bacterium]
MDIRKETGNKGEDFAATFFVSKGFRVVEKNWNCRLGEIDLIVERDGEVRFIEVKTRYSMEYGYPEEAITPAKLRHVARAIEMWLRAHPEPKHYQADALAILILPGQEPDITWIEGIL